jgi:hypothetical protein
LPFTGVFCFINPDYYLIRNIVGLPLTGRSLAILMRQLEANSKMRHEVSAPPLQLGDGQYRLQADPSARRPCYIAKTLDGTAESSASTNEAAQQTVSSLRQAHAAFATEFLSASF